MGSGLPRQSKDGGCTEVSNLDDNGVEVKVISTCNKCQAYIHLDLTPGVEEQVLWFDVPMGYALPVKISDTLEDLLEAAFYFGRRHSTFADGIVEITPWTKLHHFAPFALCDN